VSITDSQIEAARRRYFDFLEVECGAIQLEGLPADQDVGTRRMRLESLFVPLHLQSIALPNQSDTDGVPVVQLLQRRPVGEVLERHSKIAILGGPGAGKSTLMKRLSVAYASPNRLTESDDSLPSRNWVPLLIRCRQLGTSASKPVCEIMIGIWDRVEVPELALPFAWLVRQALHRGEALLLVDGLDEIADPRDRLAFVFQLRVFLATYPTINFVLTSRDVGYRIVGGALSSYCEHFEVAGFGGEDIHRLTKSWFREILGDRPEVDRDASKLAEDICSIDRVRRLATSPLLLTTLLLVKRWMGHLPTRRTVLYSKAIEVLLMTWNVEAHEPIDQDEAIPQLAYVAYFMTLAGVQSIATEDLRTLLLSARSEMPEVLGFAKTSVPEFINRIEERSSLLVLRGHELIGGIIQPVYEFQHLTFQEYLASCAIVHGFCGVQDELGPLAKLLPHLLDPNWLEVVLLASVLSGRNADVIAMRLTDLCKTRGPTGERMGLPPWTVLRLCLLEEMQVTPMVLREALRWIIQRDHDAATIANVFSKSRYVDSFLDVLRELGANGGD
jgi:predicted NACHT family NTPase